MLSSPQIAADASRVKSELSEDSTQFNKEFP